MSTTMDLNANESISTALAVSEPQISTTTIEITDGTTNTSSETTPTASTATTPTATPTTNKPIQKQPTRKKDNKNDPARFEGLGINFNAKLIGVDNVPDARGDKMCQEKMQQLKMAVRASGVHKQRILVNVSEEGIKLIDQRTGVPNYQHAVHRISFISRDSSDGRAFGYVFGDVDGSHKFFGIKTEKAAENLVLTLRDLFQIVYAKKKKEMEEAKKQQQKEQEEKVEEQKKVEEEAAEKAKTVITLGGELEQESSTDDEPVYQVPKNNAQVITEESNAGSNLVDLENELQTLGQGIEQMNQFESLFDSAESADTGTTSPASQSDPWGVNSLATSETVPKSSSSNDLADLDLFNAPVQKKKEDIMNLFGPSVPPGPQGVPPGPMGFGAAPFQTPAGNPGFQNAAWPAGPAPGTPFPVAGAPVASPFGGAPMPGAVNIMQPPPVPQRQMGGGMPPPAASNPFAADPFAAQPAPAVGGFAAFPNAPAQPAATTNENPLDQPLLPFKLENEPATEKPPEGGKSAFDDLCNIGTKDKANKAPKDLFADLSATPKKSIKEMMEGNSPSNVNAGQVRASDNPFGTLDRYASLPAAIDFSSPFPSTQSSDPFDTSFLDPSKPPHPIAKALPISEESSTEKLNLNIDKSDAKVKVTNNHSNGLSDSDDFDLPSPDGPPPPLPVAKTEELPPPILPPRPGLSNGDESLCTNVSTNMPKLPPRNNVTDSTKTVISPVPRPRPQAKLTVEDSPSIPPRPVRAVDASSTKSENNYETKSDSNKLECAKSESVISDQSKSSNNNSSTSSHGSYFIIEDPFTTSDPFADTDPFSSSDGFSSCDFISANDPFISSVFSQSVSNHNGPTEKNMNDDPFSVFDNCLNDSFNFKNSSRKSSKAGSSSKKSSLNANDPFGGVPFLPAVQNNQEAMYATVNKPKN